MVGEMPDRRLNRLLGAASKGVVVAGDRVRRPVDLHKAETRYLEPGPVRTAGDSAF